MDTPIPSTERQVIHSRYIDRGDLQVLLARLFPDQPSLNFIIRLNNDVLSFVAPRQVTEEELE
ncbi:hypothetical protein ASPWEDRAFT_44001 [Aspergillus wentii DTO 134E9]|uniref:Uncharacterized protein n=1 Tax=Aspergillus wentii DTO 134E9 TaxID=1073089 RepID=A0A1L9RAQ0_ASPWE|nr:uncharacterized protein ASPWEDRAFT_44001 [Aspergillus wentii DTO 134E9]OJJ31994.1 hypothetical protein ASPWEDRAFT_44001 [Aspergillus wentii DTO 134E9]